MILCYIVLVFQETLAQAREDKEDTEASLSADEKFLMNLKESTFIPQREMY